MQKLLLLIALIAAAHLARADQPKADPQPAVETDKPGAAKQAAPGIKATDFIRVDQDDQAARLQTAVTRYEKDGVAVDLVGAVHMADQAYYDKLNQDFEQYEAVLFEMIGGERMVDGKIPEEGADSQTTMLRQIVATMTRFLKLSGQLEEIDYAKKNFVHADLTARQFAQKQEERGESLLSFAFAAAQNVDAENAAQPNLARMVTALLSGDANGLKLEMITTLGQGDDQIAALAGDNVIIDDRNRKCLRVLRKQIAAGKKKLAIFYGAAHFPDLEERLVKKGYKRTGQQWLTAWNVPKPQPAAEPGEEKAPE